MSKLSSQTAVKSILAISIAASSFLVWWIYFKSPSVTDVTWIRHLPACNAFFNFCAAVSMCLGVFAIREKRETHHKRWMTAAFVFSVCFLLSYLTYHHFHGDTLFQGTGLIRPIYFFVLISHIILSIVALPMILTTFWFALTDRFTIHRKIAKVTFPIWLYVSITGVLIYFFLKLFNH